MSSTSKKILIVGLLLFILHAVCRICTVLEVEVDFINKLAYVSVPITTIILLAYVNDKGKDLLCKVGLVFVVGNMIFTGLQIFEVINFSLIGMNDTDKFLYALDKILSGGASLCGIVALLSLIPSMANKYDYIKKGAIGCYIVYIIIAAVYVFMDYKQMEDLSKAGSCFLILSSTAEYMFIITYLLNKTMNSNEEENNLDSAIAEQSYVGAPNVPLQQMMQQQQPAVPQQPIAPIKQEEPKPFAPSTEPPAMEQTVLMPVIQQQINNQVANQQQEQVPVQPIVQNIDNNQQQ